MKNSVKVRKIIFEILFKIYQKNINFDEVFINFTKKEKFKKEDKLMIFNVVLNSMRYNFYVQNILKKFLKKRTSSKIEILLLSAVVQIIYLNFKGYAVTNDTVEIAKIKNLNPRLINALLKNLILKIPKINKKDINKKYYPTWFVDELNNSKIKNESVFKCMENEPSLHLVFKDKVAINENKDNLLRSTEKSAFLTAKKKINKIQNFIKGNWWVQDFSSMLPVYLSPEIKGKEIIDLCAAPGGKAFQLISKKNNVVLNDINPKRIEILKKNLSRLNYNNIILNFDALSLPEDKKYDVVVLDAPCSGVGTIRRNPDILFKKKSPDLKLLVNKQKKLINKAARLLKSKGLLLYMVCSFFYKETKNIKKYFLENNSNFSQLDYLPIKNSPINNFVDKEGDIYCIPNELGEFMVDGFYSVKFIKND